MGQIADELTLGWQQQQAGRLPQAELVYRRILQTEPHHSDALYLLGTVCLRQGKLAETVVFLTQFLQLQPDHADAHSNLGIAFAGQGLLADAVTAFQHALHLDPTHADAHNNLGLALVQQGRAEEAIGHYRRANQLEPKTPDFLHNLALALTSLDQLDESVACWHAVLHLRGHDGEALNGLGIVYAKLDQLDKATACLRQSVRYLPHRADVLNHLGLTLARQWLHDEAVDAFRQALRLKPEDPDVYNNLGLALAEQYRLDEAETALQHALRLQPQLAKAHNNLGLVRVRQGRPEEALAFYAEAIRLEPAYPEAHKNRGLALLSLGQFAAGWPEYEWRWQCQDFKPRKFAQPRWDGSPLQGRTILVYAEQGLGDTLQFVRYLPLIRERGGVVLFECPTALRHLLAGFPGIDRLVTTTVSSEGFDVQIPLLSLPGVFGTDLASIPASIPYLTANATFLEEWRRELEAETRFKIGIAWHGNPKHRSGWTRNIPVAEFAPLAAIEGVRLYSLQKGAGVEQLPAPFDLVDFHGRLDGEHGAFMDSAALMKQLDLVVTLDTSLGHLAGALGVAVWVMVPFFADWRWLQNCEDSPWYPTLRLFRQHQQGDWTAVFARVVSALCERLGRLARPGPPHFRQFQSTHGTMVYPSRDRSMSQELEDFGGTRSTEIELLRRLLNPGDTVVDVGAHVGTHVLPLARSVGPSGRVLAFEPRRQLYYCLCANVVLNDLANVLCHQVVVGQGGGAVLVPAAELCCSGSPGGLDLERSMPLAGSSDAVSQTRIDDLSLAACHLIKIDVIGSECEVIVGALETIRLRRPFLFLAVERPDGSGVLRELLHSLDYLLWTPGLHRCNEANDQGQCENGFSCRAGTKLLAVPADRELPAGLAEFQLMRLG